MAAGVPPRADRFLEISDLITDVDRATGRYRPVSRDYVVSRLVSAGDSRGARIAARIPSSGGVLDQDFVNASLVRVPTELQRLSEELRMGQPALLTD
jgi:hypothetical protein